MVTSIAVHPTGHFFAVGYTDGSIAFWAVDDDSKALVTRTLDDDHVDNVDQDLLHAHLDAGKSHNDRSRFVREPVYKLSWNGFPNSSDPRGGETVLTILGGLVAPKRTTVTILAFAAFNPQAPPVDNSLSQAQLHPEFRRAMYQSVTPKKFFSYEPRGPIQDYVFLPKDNPHFGGTFNPYAIIFTMDIENTRTIEAVQFPPPNFIWTNQDQQKRSQATPDDEEKEKSLELTGPEYFVTPFVVCNAGSLVRSGRLLTLRNDVYENFVLGNASDVDTLKLKGGLAYPDSAPLNELKLSKYQPRRVLYTYNEDKTVRFFDLSSTLLISPENEPLKHAWPEPITPLTIRLTEILRNSSIVERLSTDPDEVSIQFVQAATETLELAISLNSGEVLIYHNASRKSINNPSSPKQAPDRDIILIDHIAPPSPNRLKPFFMLCAGQSQVQTFALSDIGNNSTIFRKFVHIVHRISGSFLPRRIPNCR